MSKHLESLSCHLVLTKLTLVIWTTLRVTKSVESLHRPSTFRCQSLTTTTTIRPSLFRTARTGQHFSKRSVEAVVMDLTPHSSHLDAIIVGTQPPRSA